MASILSTAKGEVLIRTATLADADGYRALRLEALKNHPTAFGQTYEDIVARPSEYWVERLAQNQDEVGLCFAEYKDQLIGMTGIFRHASQKVSHSATIWGVYVDPTWRGFHIATAMIQVCFEWAKTQKIVIIKLAVATTNQPALHCYERIGFTTYGIEPQAIFYDGKYYDEYLMSRPVDTPLS
jgi:RimJ/RimL family protein N-acetyltransferase